MGTLRTEQIHGSTVRQNRKLASQTLFMTTSNFKTRDERESFGADCRSGFSRLPRLVFASCLAIALCCSLADSAEAHDPRLSAADLRIEEDRLTADLTFTRSDLQEVPLDSVIARSALEIEVDGRRAEPGRATVQIDETNSVHFEIEFPIEAGAQLSARSPIIGSLPRGHRQYFTVKDERGRLLGERMLDASNDKIEISLDGILSTPRAFREFLVLGVEHILTGYDHLAFLFGLLLVGIGFRDVARIITSFTIAHSITLALASLNVASIAPSVVEPLIAASIVYVGVENILRRDKWRWLVTLGFGLVHGFGFASTLREMGIGPSAEASAIPLLSFNLGVELGQISIAAVTLPLIWKLRRRPMFEVRYVPVFSWGLALAGGYWLIERTLLG
ncbi:MAG TPA: HupE/UreJ family protein [Blastocatellia bacterium]|nr:HupE/UreJ family protein [Blastocatellia bacterium]